MATDHGLDAEELLHLALRATRSDRTEAALAYLDRALALAPGDARLHLLSGGLLAEQGAIEPAIDAMERAVALDTRLWGAHFQLGLLYATSGKQEEAVRAWAPLDALTDDHPLRLFKTGLERLEQEAYEACIDALEAGIAANHESDALNANMRRVVEKAEESLVRAGRRRD